MCRMEYYSAIQKKGILPLTTTEMNLEETVLGEISQKQKYCMILVVFGI